MPDLRVRVINVVDLMRLQPESEHPHGMSDRQFDGLFATDCPVIFAYHGYPWLIHRLTYRRANHQHIHVRGYIEEGTTTTPFDMVVMNNLDRYHLVMDVIDRVPGLGSRAAALRQHMVDTRIRHRAWTRTYGEDLPEVRNWRWPGLVVGRLIIFDGRRLHTVNVASCSPAEWESTPSSCALRWWRPSITSVFRSTPPATTGPNRTG